MIYHGCESGLYAVTCENNLYSSSVWPKFRRNNINNGNINNITSVNHEVNNLLNKTSLYQNYPNPFNPSTTINYYVPKESNISIKLFDLIGNEVMTIVNRSMSAGNHSLELKGANLTSGVYFYQMISNNYTETKKLLLLK